MELHYPHPPLHPTELRYPIHFHHRQPYPPKLLHDGFT
jgi:hypothetical protein